MGSDCAQPGRLPLLLLLMMVVTPSVADFTAHCPAGCRCSWVSGKKQADCAGRTETGLPLGLSPEIQVLDLRGAKVPQLGPDALQEASLENVQRLFLARSGLRWLDRHAFRGLHLLVELDLADNQLTSIDTETFSDNGKLRQLSLSGNRLQKLDDLQFPALPHIQQLNLSHCQLATISPRAFKMLTNLAELNLDGNKLAVLDPVIFQSLTTLHSLTLGGNPWRCDCHLRLFRDWLVQHNLYQHGTTCVEPERLVGKRWSEAKSEDFACRPQITIPEPQVVADLGQNVTLRCQISGNPAADTKWVLSGGRILRNNTPIPGTNQLYVIHEEGNVNRWTNLTVTRVSEQDAGQYLCVGSNPGGVVEHNVTLVFRTAVTAAPGESSGLLTGPALIGGLAGGAALLFLLLLLCCWCFCRRGGRPDKEAAGPPDHIMVINQKPPNVGGYEKLPQAERQTDVEMERLHAPAGLGEPSSSVMCNPTEPAAAVVAGAARRRSLPDSDDSHHDYPDLLHLPRRDAPADRRLAGLTAPPAGGPPRQRHSVAMRPRPSYVTLPRRPRTPKWSSSPAVSDPVYDTLGPRTTVDGSSRLSLTSVGADRPPVYYLPVESVPETAGVFSTLPRASRSLVGLPDSGHVRSLSTDLIEPLQEEPDEQDEPPPPPPPPQFNGGAPLLARPRPPPPTKPKKITPPVLPKPRLNGTGVAFQDEDEVDGTEV